MVHNQSRFLEFLLSLSALRSGSAKCFLHTEKARSTITHFLSVDFLYHCLIQAYDRKTVTSGSGKKSAYEQKRKSSVHCPSRLRQEKILRPRCVLDVAGFRKGYPPFQHHLRNDEDHPRTSRPDDSKKRTLRTTTSRAAAPAWGCEALLELEAAGSVNRLKASRVGHPLLSPNLSI